MMKYPRYQVECIYIPNGDYDMVNIISNNCIGSWITTKCIKQQLVNPFSWCTIPYESMKYIIGNYPNMNFGKFKLIADDSFSMFSIEIDGKCVVNYPHYRFKSDVEYEKKDVDIYSNHVWELVVSKYIERTKRMIHMNLTKPIFILSYANRHPLKNCAKYTVDEIDDIKCNNKYNYPIYTSFEYYQNPNNIKQSECFYDNGIQLAKYLYGRIPEIYEYNN